MISRRIHLIPKISLDQGIRLKQELATGAERIVRFLVRKAVNRYELCSILRGCDSRTDANIAGHQYVFRRIGDHLRNVHVSFTFNEYIDSRVGDFVDILSSLVSFFFDPKFLALTSHIEHYITNRVKVMQFSIENHDVKLIF